mmetsp:Transcript_58454/g.161701  ORF Transcript_58454/g.161701 Transcript_58454/m.161701 type:complete len:247 (+) Transcript_58454:853-1593(+)
MVAQKLGGRDKVPPRVVVARHLVRVDLGIGGQHVVVQQSTAEGFVCETACRQCRRPCPVVRHRPAIQPRAEVAAHHGLGGRHQPHNARLTCGRAVIHRVREACPLLGRLVRVGGRGVDDAVPGPRHQRPRGGRRREDVAPLGSVPVIAKNLADLVQRPRRRHGGNACCQCVTVCIIAAQCKHHLRVLSDGNGEVPSHRSRGLGQCRCPKSAQKCGHSGSTPPARQHCARCPPRIHHYIPRYGPATR